jgi:hexosaminidase
MLSSFLAVGPEVITPVPVKINSSSKTVRLPSSAFYELDSPESGLSAEEQSYGISDLKRYIGENTIFRDKGKERQNKAFLKIILSGMDKPLAKSRKLPEFARKAAYSLKISRDKITIKANTSTGAFYAIQDLIMMIDIFNTQHSGLSSSPVLLKCCRIFDYPRFAYRGLMFDTSRHFRSREFIIKQIDLMALAKLNKLHLHLTDAEGWRLQIDKYPALTQKTAWRTEEDLGKWHSGKAEYSTADSSGAYGGFYTKDDIRSIVNYARVRHIEVIPEIEMPGHSREVLHAFPELACVGRSDTASRGGELCPGNEKTYEFLENVLSEVAELFPSKYIHIGGDEARKAAWKDCPLCKEKMEEEGMTDVNQLQSYLIERIEKFLNSKGKIIIGWNEILKGGLAPNATVMSWQGTKGGLKAIAMGHDVIMTPEKYCYLDRYQDDPDHSPVAFNTYVPLDTVYSYDPADKAISKKDLHHLLGLQGNLWGEYISTDNHAEYMLYPRAFAIAEVGWSLPARKNQDEFRKRVVLLSGFLKSKGYGYFDITHEYGPPSD